MPLVFWCDGNQLAPCDYEHPGFCTDICASMPTHSFGGGRTLRHRPAFNGPPRGLQTSIADSMDAFHSASDWQEGQTKLLVNDGLANGWTLKACWNPETKMDREECGDAVNDCTTGREDWKRNCGWRAESTSDMAHQHCVLADLIAPCPADDIPIQFRADPFTGRTAFIGGAGMGSECLGNLNPWCFGTDSDGGRCTSAFEARRWDRCRMNWSNVQLVRPTQNAYSRPEIEHALQRAALRYVREHATPLNIAHILRPDTSGIGKIDQWKADWPPAEPPIGCTDYPVIASLPGGRLSQSGCDVTADLVLFGVQAWMSLHMRREDTYGGIMKTLISSFYTATIQIGLDIDCRVRAAISGECSTGIGQPCLGKADNGERIVFKDGGRFYRPPLYVKWRGEATPMTGGVDLTKGIDSSFDRSANGLCNALRLGFGSQQIKAKSIAKGSLPGDGIEAYGGAATIVRIGD